MPKNPNNNRSEVLKDLEMLNKPVFDDGVFNLCYGDNYYALSLKQKWGMSARELQRLADSWKR